MDLELGGLHHATAVTANASLNVDFYTRVLGLRLVKKTVNQDDVSAYHLFYGDEVGKAGTEVTFFDWSYTAPNRAGAREISEIGLRVPDEQALDWWKSRFDELDVPHGEVEEHGGFRKLTFSDPEGQRLSLIDDTSAGPSVDPGRPWDQSPVPAEHGIRGLGVYTITVQQLEPTALVLSEALGFRQTGDWMVGPEERRLVRFETGPGGSGATILVQVAPNLSRAMLGHGGVHHIAFRVPNDEQHQAWQQRLTQLGLQATPVIDRFYFHSIYFREPGGILFELATDGPGFATDEDVEHLGESLALPPFLEPRRAEIEAGLKPIENRDPGN